jgi:adenosine deaminase
MKELKERKIGLEINISSNVDIGIIKTVKEHPFKEIFEYGILCSISSDDPTFFRTSIGNEYKQVEKEFELGKGEMMRLYKNSIEMSFANDLLKRELLSYIDCWEVNQKMKILNDENLKNEFEKLFQIYKFNCKDYDDYLLNFDE